MRPITQLLGTLPWPAARRVFDLGCGNGATAAALAKADYEVVGCFPAVISLEVVEHVFLPLRFAQCVYNLLEPGGTAMISTPYHGYLKNLALALTGKMDSHFTALWDYGHIKFWSQRTLAVLLEEAGLKVERFVRAGRIPVLAKSMIAVAHRP